jgi:hypothetical protein
MVARASGRCLQQRLARQLHAKEVFHVSINPNEADQQAEEILDTLQQIQANPELLAEAQTDPERVLNRFALSGVARHAVAFGIAGILVAPAVVHAQMFWGS